MDRLHAPAYMPPTDVLPDTLGYTPVYLEGSLKAQVAARPAIELADVDVSQRAARFEARIANEVLLDQVDQVRSALATLTGDERQVVEGYLREHIPDMPLGKHASYVEWLTDYKNGASTNQVMSVLKRHNAEIATHQQDPEVQAEIEEGRTFYLEAHERAIKAGQLAEGSLDAPAVESARVYIGDIWDTHLKHRVGYHPHGKNMVVIAQGYEGSSQQRVRDTLLEVFATLPHELAHVSELGSFLPAWAREAIVEHATLSFAEGQFSVLDPRHREKDSRVYASERRLMSALIHAAPVKIDSSFLTRAFSSKGYTSEEFQEFEKRLDLAWGKSNMFQRVAHQVEQESAAIAAAHPDWTMARVQSEATLAVSKDLEEYARRERNSSKAKAATAGRIAIAH